MRSSEARVHSGVRVQHVCTENADVTIWLPMGVDVILEKPLEDKFASRSNPL